MGLDDPIATLSRFFLDLDAEGFEAGVREKLPDIAGLAGADRVRLYAVRTHPHLRVSKHEWPDGEDPLRTGRESEVRPDALRFQWGRRLLQSGRIIHVPSVSELPAEAEIERRDLESRGVRATLAIPLRSGPTILGYQVFERFREEVGWSEDEISLLCVVAEIFARAIQRKEAQEVLFAQRAAEGSISELARRLLSAPAEGIEETLRQVLPEAAALGRADRVAFHSFGLRGAPRITTFEWAAPGVRGGLTENARWTLEKALRGEVIHVPRVDDLPEEAAAERDEMLGRGVKSMLGIPVLATGHLVGFLALQTLDRRRRWADWEITLLQLVARLFSEALKRLRVEEALRQRELQLHQARRLESLGCLAGGIAHDFNNLLAVILGFSGPMLSDLDDGDPRRGDLEAIHEAAEKAAALTRQLLQFSQRQPPAPGHEELDRTLRDLGDLLRHLAGEAIDVVLEPGAEGCRVRGDASQLEQVIVNLALNARDAMPGGGRLRVGTRVRELGRHEGRRLGFGEARRVAELRVEDSGPGLPPGAGDRIFDPFYTTKQPGEGSGLGLAIVYSIARSLEGAVSARSEPGRGTIFEVLLPLEHDGTD